MESRWYHVLTGMLEGDGLCLPGLTPSLAANLAIW